MSSDVLQMARSLELVLGEYSARFPEYRADLAAHSEETLVYFAERALARGRLATALKIVRKLLRTNPRQPMKWLPRLLRTGVRTNLVPGTAKLWVKRRLRRTYSEQQW